METNAKIYPMHGPRAGHQPAEPRRHSPRVLGDATRERLGRVNDVCRRLRKWGIAIQSINVMSDRAKVVITRDPAISIKPLLDAGVTWVSAPAKRIGVCVLDGVAIKWEERA